MTANLPIIDLTPAHRAAAAARESSKPLDALESNAGNFSHAHALLKKAARYGNFSAKAELDASAKAIKSAEEQLDAAKTEFLRLHQELWNETNAALRAAMECGNTALSATLRALDADYPERLWSGSVRLNKSIEAVRMETRFVWRKHARLLAAWQEFKSEVNSTTR